MKYDTVTDQMRLDQSKERLEKRRNSIEEKQIEKNSQYKELYIDILQQLECEKKINLQMTDVLENKVSELIAENSTLKLKNIQIQKDFNSLEGEINGFKQ